MAKLIPFLPEHTHEPELNENVALQLWQEIVETQVAHPKGQIWQLDVFELRNDPVWHVWQAVEFLQTVQ